jgi:hypothetical protein
MTRLGRIFEQLALGMLALALLATCTTLGVQGQKEQGSSPVLEDPASRPGAKTVLIALPQSRDFLDARKGLVTEIKRDFNIATMVVTPSTNASEFGAAIERTSAVCLVLMNNATLLLYQQYQAQAGQRKTPPAVVLMTSFLEESSSRVNNVTGIAYEVPGVTAFVHLRSVVKTPVTRIGVVFRPAFGHFVERQKVLAAREHFELVSVPVPADVSADGLLDALRSLTDQARVDALWMLNDNGLIRDGLFLADTWRLALRDVSLPLLVGVPNLVDPIESFGTLAVVPDHEALGLQAANLIFDLADNDWKLEGRGVDLPLSVKTIVDMKQARERFGLKPDADRHIDRPLEGGERAF